MRPSIGIDHKPQPARALGAIARAAGALCVLIVVAACQAASPSLSSTASAERAPVSATRALATFEQICGASLPNFGDADSRMKAAGFVELLGKMHQPDENFSVRILDGPGFGKTCSFVFATNENDAEVERIFAELGQVTDSSAGRATLYRGSKALVLFAPPLRRGGLTYHNIRMLSERN